MAGGATGVKLLLKGPPRVGKTTLVERLVRLIEDRGRVAGGFLTRELREHGERVGFAACDIVTGDECVIADIRLASAVRVGRFGVDVRAFERLALPALARADSIGGIVVVDEIARMELASKPFTDQLAKIMDSPHPVVATVHIHAHPFTDTLIARTDIELMTVTEHNRETLPRQILDRLAGT